MYKLIIFVIIYFISIINITTYSIQTIDINGCKFSKIPIAINNFYNNIENSDNLDTKIINIIKEDLNKCGLFSIINSNSFIEKTYGVKHVPKFHLWQNINVHLLLNGEITNNSENQIKMNFTLWDTILKKNIISAQIITSKNFLRRSSHTISNIIYEKITGDKGCFNSRIVYISESIKHNNKLIKKVAIMDYDGHNNKYITNGDELVLTPRLSHNGDKILYLSYSHDKRKHPQVYLFDLINHKKALIGNFSGMSFAPRFSSDDNKALICIAKSGSSHIYEINFLTMSIKQITYGNHINTSPSYSPNDQKIVFNSDRSGTKQLYIMNSDGSNIERISFSGSNYFTPNWSPKGDFIAFTKYSKKLGFQIGIMRPINTSHGDNEEKIITSGFLVEGPCWSPNGKMLMYTKTKITSENNKKNKLYSINITGDNEQQIATPTDASDPHWEY